MKQVSTTHAALAGLSASLVGIGLARFAYTPLIPALIAAHWFAPASVVYLGAANLAGYLAGALAARPLAAWKPAPGVLRGMMLLATASFFASVAPVSLAWFGAWRFAAGLAGGVFMVLAAPTVLAHAPPRGAGCQRRDLHRRRGGYRRIRHAGAAAATRGLPATWLGLGPCAVYVRWPGGAGPPSRRTVAVATPLLPPGTARWAPDVEYGLNAAGMVPHMVFLVDFVARGLGQGLTVGAEYWVVYGLGALGGPLLAGAVATGPASARLAVAYLVEAVAVALPIWSTVPVGWHCPPWPSAPSRRACAARAGPGTRVAAGRRRHRGGLEYGTTMACALPQAAAPMDS